MNDGRSMKALTNSQQHSSADKVRRTAIASDQQDQSPYVSTAQTNALLNSSLASRRERLAAADMISTDEAASMVGSTRVTVNAWIAKGRCVGLTQSKRGFRLPKWQFEPAIWDHLAKLSAALGTADGWALLTFLETPQGALNGATPRVALEQGDSERVLNLAAQE